MNLEDVKNAEIVLKDVFSKIDDVCFYNSRKVISAFWKENVNEACFNSTTGYGYGDYGRDIIEKVYADVFKCEKALVRNQFISGTHAISTALFALLRPGDTLLSITGRPYDTLDSVIGFNDNKSSLKSFGIKYEQIDLVDNDFNYKEIEEFLNNNKVKLIEVQRSIGYSTRKSISIDVLEKVIKLIKSIDKDIIIISSNMNANLRKKYLKQYNNIKFIKNDSYHDRFIIIDRKRVFHSGASFKDLGRKCFGIHEIENSVEIEKLINEVIKKCSIDN